MGWLDNSTNNIILDAVLTDYGRQALARNNGSFNITKFSLGDDEVNYGIIQNNALKHKLVGVPAPLVYYPKLTLETLSQVEFTTDISSMRVTVTQSKSSNDSSSAINSALADANFDVYYPSLFLEINGTTANQTSMDTLRTAHLVVQSTGATQSSGNTGDASKQATFTVAKRNLADTTYRTYGRQVSVGGATKYRISTLIKVVGQSSGLTLDIPVTITQ
jgi:hypothetical protein